MAMTNEELVALIQAGEQERMGELWEQIAALVKWKADRHMNVWGDRGGVAFDDLVQAGYLALSEAVKTYDPAAECSFSGWFMYYLKKEFADAAGLRTKKAHFDPIHHAASLNTPLSDDGEDELQDIMADPAGEHLEEAVIDGIWRKQVRAVIAQELERMPERGQEVLHLRYWDDLTLQEIGDRFGVARERVRQIEAKAMRQLRRSKKISALWDFNFYAGTGLGSFLNSGYSVQEQYLIRKEETRRREYKAMQESIDSRVNERIAAMTPEERERLLREYGML